MFDLDKQTQTWELKNIQVRSDTTGLLHTYGQLLCVSNEEPIILLLRLKIILIKSNLANTVYISYYAKIIVIYTLK